MEQEFQKKAIAFIKKRLEQERNDLTNGWSVAESGPCCEKCILKDEHFNGRADALKSVVGCRDPFQINCSCHLKYRETSEKAIKAALKSILFYFETRPDLM